MKKGAMDLKKSKGKRLLKWTTPVAAMLAIAIGVFVFFRDGGGEIRARAISEAK